MNNVSQNERTGMPEKEGSHLGKMFMTTFLVSAVLVFGVYAVGGFEVAALFAICWLVAVIATTSVGIENIIGKELAVFRRELKGYLFDMYAEMIKKD